MVDLAPYSETHPHLVSEWHPTKNEVESLDELVGKPKTTYVWWLCSTHDYSWRTRLSHRLNGSGCPVCSGNKVVPGINDLTTTHPHLAATLHPTKNSQIDITTLSSRTTKAVWWFGPDCKHEWEQGVLSRVKSGHKDCAVCSGVKLLSGVNDFATKFPALAAEWHPTKNSPLQPNQVFPGSNRKIWWYKEGCGHEWEASLLSRTGKDKTGCLVCSHRVVVPEVNDFKSLHPNLVAEWHPTKNGDLKPNQIAPGVKIKIWWRCSNDSNHEWATHIYNRTGPYQKGCPHCARKISKSETMIADRLTEAGFTVQRNVRTILSNSNLELDIYVPEKNVAIEFNGLYWHSEKYKPRTYHHDKWLACKEEGIQLVQIWEDEWSRNPELIMNLLLHKLGNTSSTRIYARKTEIRTLAVDETNHFLNTYHIQGSTNGSIRLGLVEKGNPKTIVAVMLLKKDPTQRDGTLNLLRYATSKHVVGGFTKLLKHVEKNHQPTRIITFADHCVSDGGLYENNGFISDKELPPDYMYVNGRKREHKFNYRLKRFREDPSLLWETGLTERELATLNNLLRIWDAGKTRWVKEYRSFEA